MLKIGLTGGIGSGKTTVSSLFKSFGVPIIDMDEIARHLTQAGAPGFQLMLNRFGNDILTTHNELNRKKLRELIFQDPEHTEWIKTTFHPLILQETLHLLKAITEPYVVLVIPLLVEDDLMHHVDRVLIVDVPETLQLERASQRDNASTESIQKIMAHQAPRATRLQAGHDIIVNTGTLNDLQKQVEALHQKYIELCQNYYK